MRERGDKVRVAYDSKVRSAETENVRVVVVALNNVDKYCTCLWCHIGV